MSAYDYEHFVDDFIKRTKANLNTINDIVKNDPEIEAYEITQLINSLFGLLIVPNEKYKDFDDEKLKGDGYNELANAIKKIKCLYTNYKDDKDDYDNFKVSQFIRHLRNALAHLGQDRVLFLDKDEKLAGVLLYDKHVDKETKTINEFCAELDFDSFKEIVSYIIEIYSNRKRDFDKEYHNKIVERQKIFSREK